MGAITAPIKGAAAGTIPMMGAPTPASPDPLTAQALAPAAGGPPTKAVPDARADAAAPTRTTGPLVRRDRRAPDVADLKTIDTGKAAPAGGIGIQGIGNTSVAKPVAPAAAQAAPGNSQQ